MRVRSLLSSVPALALAAAVLFTPQPSAGQAKAPAPKAAATKGAPKSNAYKAPRTPDGKADLQGIWQVLGAGTAAGLEPHTPMLGLPAGFGAIVDPAEGKIPYTPAARAKQQENLKNRAALDPDNKCYLPGAVRMMALNFPFQILQTPKTIALLSEYGHATRNVFLTGQHLEGIDMWMGDSRGRWEGDTLVVDVKDNNASTWLDSSGNFGGGGLHVVERFTRTGPDTLQYEATLDDSATYTRPFTMRLTLYRHTEPNFRVLEYDCNAYMEFEGK